jgi:hypothetical protein
MKESESEGFMGRIKSPVAFLASVLFFAACSGGQPATSDVAPESGDRDVSIRVVNNLGSTITVSALYPNTRNPRVIGRVSGRSQETFMVRWDSRGLRMVVESNAERRSTTSNEIEQLTPAGTYVLTVTIQFQAQLEERGR